MTIVEVGGLSYGYGSVEALHEVDLVVPDGAVCALLGPNGAGKTTLLQLLAGLRRPRTGRVSLFGVASHRLPVALRARVAYVAEGQRLPGWMTLAQLEAYLAPLYAGWDRTLAAELRTRFALDGRRRLRTLSRGERMKAAMLCALAPRPSLLLMDEPFTGMDAIVKDQLVRGLLGSARAEGWTVVVSSHDINELELLADRVAVLANGRMLLDESLDVARARFRRVTVVADGRLLDTLRLDGDCLDVERAGRRLSFIARGDGAPDAEARLHARFGAAERVEIREATLREIFVALARPAPGAAARAAA